MTYPTYSEQYLLTLTPKQVKSICKNLGIAPHFHKAICIQRIIEHQATVKPAAPKTNTCKDCPYFTSHNDGSDRGWCECFNHFAREGHHETQDCINQYWEADKTEEEERAVEPAAIATAKQQDGYTVATLHAGEILLNRDEWHTAQSELTQHIEEKAEKIAPEPVQKVSENVYRVLSSAGTHRYQVDLWKRSCTCPAGAHRNPCRHIPTAEAKQRQEVTEEMTAKAKIPAGWVWRGGWWVNHHGHRQNTPPMNLSERELTIFTR